MEARFSRPGVRWVFLTGVFAVAGTLAFSGGRIALANHYAAGETSEGLGRAAHLEPGNAEHSYFLGRYWQYNFDQPDLPLAISYYQRALALDPRSANTWMDLAGAREAQGDTAQAREAFEQAQKAHPISADVAWRYANFLLRQGEIRQAYSQVRRAVAEDPNRAAAAVSVCWRANPNIEMILDQALPRSAAVYREAIRFLSNEHEGSAALAVWKRLAELHPRIELKTVFPLLDELFVEDFIPEARSVWEQAVEMAGITPSAPSDGSLVWDGGFEGDFIPGGFGWRWRPDPGVQFTFDRETKHSGGRSLRITFDGTENLNFTHLFQYVPVQPGKTYQFSAYVKTEEITTNRGLCFAVFDSRNPGATGRLTPDLTGTQPWTRLELSFTAGSDTRLETVVLRRIPSEKLDNKLRGTVWVDDVAVVPLELGPKRPAP